MPRFRVIVPAHQGAAGAQPSASYAVPYAAACPAGAVRRPGDRPASGARPPGAAAARPALAGVPQPAGPRTVTDSL
ncbi:hypothetical protein AB0L74_04530 [Streptomyces sp. NPDC052020]|uniref:hypothetical protein n=1 Tax=Streptomyces sp. NPDC052020 TaxID=3155677 RepID=UPI003419BA53